MEVVYLMSLLQTLLVEVAAIINSRQLTANVQSDFTSLAPLSLVNLLTIKSKVVMPPPGHFISPDQYCRKQWKRVQHLSNEFWNQWEKEVLLTLQNREKWNKKQKIARLEMLCY